MEMILRLCSTGNHKRAAVAEGRRVAAVTLPEPCSWEAVEKAAIDAFNKITASAAMG
jgi:hypothetical protein